MRNEFAWTVGALLIAFCAVAADTTTTAGFGGTPPSGEPPSGDPPGGEMPSGEPPSGEMPGGIGGGAFVYDTVVSVTTNADGTLMRGGIVYGYAFEPTAIDAGESVAALADGAFAGCSNLVKVDLSGSAITCVPSDCFAGCKALTTVVLPQTCVAIGPNAFAGCTSLKKVLARAVKNVGDYAFDGCAGLTSAVMRDTTFNDTVFRGCPDGLTPTSTIRLAAKRAEGRGTVSGGGWYEAGKTVALMATAKSGYVFAGWFTDSDCTTAFQVDGYDYRAAKGKFSMPDAATKVYAKCVTEESDAKSLRFKSSAKTLAKSTQTLSAGDAASLKAGFSSISQPSVTVSGLPKGLTLDESSGKITGTPVKPGSYTVKIKIANASGASISLTVKMKVTVPSWAKGTFYGLAYTGGTTNSRPAYLKFTAGSLGKISGKLIRNGKSYSFTSAYVSCTSGKAKFAPSVSIASSTYEPDGKVVVSRIRNGVTCSVATDAEGLFYAQKKVTIVRDGKALSGLVGDRYVFRYGTDSDIGNSGLKQDGDRIAVKIGEKETATIAGVVGGVKFTGLSWPLLVDGKEDSEDGGSVYTAHLDIVEPATKYFRTLVLDIAVGSDGEVSGVDGSFER